MRNRYIKNYSGMILLALLLLTLCSAQDCSPYGTFRQGTSVSLSQTCTSCSQINATITYPDSSSTGLIQFQNINGIYNYTFSNTTQLGTYNVIGKDAWCYSFTINSNGVTGTTGFYFIVFAIIALILILGFYTEESWIVILGGLFTIVLGLYCMINGIMGITDQMLNVFISAMIMVVGFYISIKSSLDLINWQGGD